MPTSNRAWKVVFGYGLAATAVFYVVRHAGLNGAAFAREIATLRPLYIAIALAAFGMHVFINSLAFSLLSQALGAHLPLRTLSSAWAGSLVAKYVPGGVWHVVGRGLLLGKLGLPARTTMITGVLEQGISIFICALIAGCAYLLVHAGVAYAITAAMVVLGCAALLSIFVIPVFVAGMNRILFVLSVAGYSFAMIPYAMGYTLLVQPADMILFLYALFAGTVAGVLALVVPGGLGVREAGAVLLFASADSEQVMAAMLAARFLLLICDVLGTIFGLRLVNSSGRSG